MFEYSRKFIDWTFLFILKTSDIMFAGLGHVPKSEDNIVGYTESIGGGRIRRVDM